MQCKRDFFAGVVEGFYGRPWNLFQRKKLFTRLNQLGLKSYLYAPKDDLKHRKFWRELYNDQEAVQLKILIDSAKLNDIIFIYSISPGLDITFSNGSDIFLLKQKLNQVLNLGCNAFALLFDDIEPSLKATDKLFFHSFGFAQSTIANDIYNFLNKPYIFLFCPTEYCSTRAVPFLSASEYLQTIGEMLLPEIDIMWTGPKVVSKFISLESILKLTTVLKRPPVIWDNIHANDYDQRRLFLGPYCGRPVKLKSHIRGVFLNPNCEFEANFIAIHTFAQWARVNKPIQSSNSTVTVNKQKNDSEDEYLPSKALEFALIDWLKLIYMKENNIEVSQYSNHRLTEIPNSEIIQQRDIFTNSPIMYNQEESVKSIDLVKNESNSHDSNNIMCPKLEKKELYQNVKEPDKVIISVIDNSTNKESFNNINPINNLEEKVDCYAFKTFHEKDPLGNNKIYSQIDMAPKNEKLIYSVDQSEMILDQVMNLFPLTPMEIEDNQAESELMAMQVDNFYEATYEKMDVFDEMENNNNIEKKKDLKCTSLLKDSKSDMEFGFSTISNENTEIISFESSQLTIEDLKLLVNIFFLPYEHGPYAIKMLKTMQWLRLNAYVIDRKNKNYQDKDFGVSIDQCSSDFNESGENLENKLKLFEWHQKAKEFIKEIEKIKNMICLFTAIPNRSILYDLYPYLQDIRHVFSTLVSYVKWMGCIPNFKESLMNDDHEPWVFRGGLVGEFQRMFPLEGSNDLFPNKILFLDNSNELILSSSSDDSEIKIKSNDIYCQNLNDKENHSQVYIIRPYCSSDRDKLYKLCFDIVYSQLCEDQDLNPKELVEFKLEKFKDLPGDLFVGIFLEFPSDICVLLENGKSQVCGFGFGIRKVKEFLKFRQESYNSKIRKKYDFYTVDKEFHMIVSENLGNISLDDPIEKSIIGKLIHGFNGVCQNFDIFSITDHCGLINVDFLNDCNDTYLEFANSVGYRLLKYTCSSLKTMLQASECISPKGFNINLPNFVTKPSEFDNDKTNIFSDKAENQTKIQNSCIDGSEILSIFCEIDNQKKRHENFYKEYGFNACNLSNNSNDDESYNNVKIYVLKK